MGRAGVDVKLVVVNTPELVLREHAEHRASEDVLWPQPVLLVSAPPLQPARSARVPDILLRKEEKKGWLICPNPRACHRPPPHPARQLTPIPFNHPPTHFLKPLPPCEGDVGGIDDDDGVPAFGPAWRVYGLVFAPER